MVKKIGGFLAGLTVVLLVMGLLNVAFVDTGNNSNVAEAATTLPSGFTVQEWPTSPLPSVVQLYPLFNQLGINPSQFASTKNQPYPLATLGSGFTTKHVIWISQGLIKFTYTPGTGNKKPKSFWIYAGDKLTIDHSVFSGGGTLSAKIGPRATIGLDGFYP